MRHLIVGLAAAAIVAACDGASPIPSQPPAACQVLSTTDLEQIEGHGCPIYAAGEDMKAFARKHLDWMFGPRASAAMVTSLAAHGALPAADKQTAPPRSGAVRQPRARRRISPLPGDHVPRADLRQPSGLPPKT